MMTTESHGQVLIRDFDVRDVMADAALVTYRTVGTSGQARRSSLWVRESGKWRMVFHQGTRLPDASSPGG